jgi:hypothetical protein
VYLSALLIRPSRELPCRRLSPSCPLSPCPRRQTALTQFGIPISGFFCPDRMLAIRGVLAGLYSKTVFPEVDREQAIQRSFLQQSCLMSPLQHHGCERLRCSVLTSSAPGELSFVDLQLEEPTAMGRRGAVAVRAAQLKLPPAKMVDSKYPSVGYHYGRS